MHNFNLRIVIIPDDPHKHFDFIVARAVYVRGHEKSILFKRESVRVERKRIIIDIPKEVRMFENRISHRIKSCGIVLSLFFCAMAWTTEEGCPVTEVRLDGSGGSMASVNTIDQGDLGICYAAVAAQAAAAKHGSTGYCPLSVAADDARVHRERGESALEGGMVCRAIRSANTKGYCQNCGPFYEQLKLHYGGGGSFFRNLNSLYNSFIQLTKRENPRDWRNLLTNAESGQRIAQNFRHDMCSGISESLRAQLIFPAQDVLLRALRAENPGEYFNAMIETTCTERNPRAGGRSPACSDKRWPTPSTTRNLLRGHFTSNTAMPVGMEFCSNMFTVSNPEDFQSTFPVGVGRMVPFNDWGDADERLKWLLQSFEHRMIRAIEKVQARIIMDGMRCGAVHCKDGTEIKNTLAYVERIKTCMENFRTRTMNTRGQRNTYSRYLDARKNPIGNPLATLASNALTACERDLTPLQEALPDTPGYSQAIRNSLTTDLRTQLEIGEKERNCGGHAVLVIGTRCSNNKRQYLLRNFWGQDCDGYSHDTSVSNSECEAGTSTIWVNEDVVINNTFRLNKIE